MKGSERRKKIIEILRNSPEAISGSELGKKLNVSRQVIVQDMALLRSEGIDIISTSKGYDIDNAPKEKGSFRIIKVNHTAEQVYDELSLVVDLGGTVKDVFVNHRTYGRISAPLNIKSRRDAKKFVDDLESGKSTPLLNVTAGYHFHTIIADSEEILNEIEEALGKAGYLAELTDYEKENF